MIYTLCAFYLILGYLSYIYAMVPLTDLYLPMFHDLVREPKLFLVFVLLWLPLIILSVLSIIIDILIGKSIEDIDEETITTLYDKYKEKKRGKKK